jgi:hypothetical protein|eukprot:COSAG06_NODE_903_length_11646_cov_15.420975_10_plen_97_part_00
MRGNLAVLTPRDYRAAAPRRRSASSARQAPCLGWSRSAAAVLLWHPFSRLRRGEPALSVVDEERCGHSDWARDFGKQPLWAASTWVLNVIWKNLNA